jgi:hypothetical protein
LLRVAAGADLRPDYVDMARREVDCVFFDCGNTPDSVESFMLTPGAEPTLDDLVPQPRLAIENFAARITGPKGE